MTTEPRVDKGPANQVKKLTPLAEMGEGMRAQNLGHKLFKGHFEGHLKTQLIRLRNFSC